VPDEMEQKPTELWNCRIEKKCTVGVKFCGSAGLLSLGGCVSFLHTLAYLTCKSGSGSLDTDNLKSMSTSYSK